MNVFISGVAGFIGSHLADYLIEQGHKVKGIDNLLSGSMENVNKEVEFFPCDTRDSYVHNYLKDVDWVFHLAANARTQLSVEDPMLNHDLNITGTLNMLLAARNNKVKRFVFASSCILYSPNTPYYVSKLAGEEYAKVFESLYGLSTVSLRYSNVYGSLRQSEKGSHINALASLHKSKRDTGRVWITGDGAQTRDWTHVTDICKANLLAAQSKATGVYDICTGQHTTMNEVAKYFNCPIDYVPDAPGDAKHLSLSQDPKPALEAFGYKFTVPFNHESIKVYL